MASTKKEPQGTGLNISLNEHYALHNSYYCYTLYNKSTGQNVLYVNDLDKCIDKSVAWIKKHGQTISEETKKELEELKKENAKTQAEVAKTINDFIDSLS